MKTALVLIATLAVSGCATTLSSAARSVKESDEKGVADCKFVGSVEGSSGFGNLAAKVGMQNAKNEAIEKAAKLSATHIVFGEVRGGFSPSAQGRAYHCR